MMFVDDNRPGVGYQLTRKNWKYAPHGRIHVVRYTTGFDPAHGLGYYSDIYLRQFIRQWKQQVVTKKKRRAERYMSMMCLSRTLLIVDVRRSITEFL